MLRAILAGRNACASGVTSSDNAFKREQHHHQHEDRFTAKSRVFVPSLHRLNSGHSRTQCPKNAGPTSDSTSGRHVQHCAHLATLKDGALHSSCVMKKGRLPPECTKSTSFPGLCDSDIRMKVWSAWHEKMFPRRLRRRDCHQNQAGKRIRTDNGTTLERQVLCIRS